MLTFLISQFFPIDCRPSVLDAYLSQKRFDSISKKMRIINRYFLFYKMLVNHLKNKEIILRSLAINSKKKKEKKNTTATFERNEYESKLWSKVGK